jgi:hypothetical protein
MAGAGSAAAEIRTFSTPTDFRYQDSAPVHCGYQERLKLGEPDRVRKLDPRPSSFTSPYGFLTGVHDLIRRVLQNSSDPNRVRKTSASLNYAYNGRTYLLELKSTDYLKKFDLELAAGQLKDNKPFVSFDDVAKADFRITNLTTSEKHDFTLWFPLTGQLRGVPLRIVDKPRWWLRIELNLDPDAKTAPPRANLDCSISAQ